MNPEPDFSTAFPAQGIVVGARAKHNFPKPIDIIVKFEEGRYWVWHAGREQWERCWL